MSPSSGSLLKTLVVPAVISLVLFLVLTFVLVPVSRRYRNRYAQYLPLDSISDRTSSLRHRITNRFTVLNPLAIFLGARAQNALAGGGAADDDDDGGEELGDVDEETWRVIGRHVPQAQAPDHANRLSRDLEEGFMDDSDDETASR